MTRISLTRAVECAIELGVPLGVEHVPLDACAGRVLAEEIEHAADLPPFDHAAMDGYAIAGAAARGRSFVVESESRAGAPAASALPGAAVAISTGAAIPAGVDTVVPWEDVERTADRITLTRDARAGQHVRRAGEDARRGERALGGGVRLAGRHVALLATLERREVAVHLRPRVEVLTTGDELRDPGSEVRPGSIVDSNGPMLAALVAQAGGRARVTRVPDREGALVAALDARREDADLIVTVGGAADGQHDHVLRALEVLGAERTFRGVAIKPGKPVALSRLGGLPLLALPGNPGSAFVTFVLLGIPLLRRLGGERDVAAPRRLARAGAPLRAPADRAALVYGVLAVHDDELVFTPAPPSSSGSVVGLARASAIAIVAPGEERSAGARVEIVEVDVA